MRYALFFLSVIILSACASKHGTEQNESTAASSSPDGFNEFYNRFSVDSAYQVAHIAFPLRTEVYDTDTPTVSAMDAREWGYMDFDRKAPYIVSILSANDTVKVNFQKDGTGIYADYLFTVVGGRWMLVKVVDQST